MADIEKVIKALKCRAKAENRCSNPCERIGMCEYAKLIVGNDGEPYYPYICDKKRICEDALELLKEYKRQDGCPCTHCMEWECDEVCEEYKKWKDT